MAKSAVLAGGDTPSGYASGLDSSPRVRCRFAVDRARGAGEALDLALAAHNGWVISLDNLSRLPGWLSDALCRVSTGGEFATRALYENEEVFTC